MQITQGEPVRAFVPNPLLPDPALFLYSYVRNRLFAYGQVLQVLSEGTEK